jgi:hypothetical protein
VLLTDAPIDQFCQVRATVTGIDLLGDVGATNVYSGDRTIDVLAMRNFSDFFTVDPSVSIGTYDKVRLTLSDLALVECDDKGQPEPESGWDHPQLPGNGKLDLNPRGSFEVVGGEMLVIELDLDMECSDYTQRTLYFFADRLFPQYGKHCGVVIQSMLRRSEADIERMIALGARVRLCKGAYLESADVAFPDKADVDRNYLKLMERLLVAGNYPGLATHDERIIGHARAFVAKEAIGIDRFEFQMLYGVRRDLQERLRRAGYHMRVYIPFGTQWYPYLMRRLAERPANIAFLLGNIMRESVPGR